MGGHQGGQINEVIKRLLAQLLLRDFWVVYAHFPWKRFFKGSPKTFTAKFHSIDVEGNNFSWRSEAEKAHVKEDGGHFV